MFDYLWIFHALYSICRMAHFCNILPTGCKLGGRRALRLGYTSRGQASAPGGASQVRAEGFPQRLAALSDQSGS